MTKADEMNFERTQNGHAESIIAGPGGHSSPSAWVAGQGDSVELRHAGQKLQVRDVFVEPDGNLEGEIFDFTNRGATEYAGLELNQIITFTQNHVFHVTRKNP